MIGRKSVWWNRFWMSYNGTTSVSFGPAFYGAPPRHSAVSRSIFKIVENVQSKFWSYHVWQSLEGCRFFEEDLSRGIKIGFHNYGANITYFHLGEPIIQHKCEGCGSTQELGDDGNNYFKLSKAWNTYGPDA